MQTAAEWQMVFWITALVYAIGVVFFALTVSGEKQPWNDDPTGDGWKSSESPADPDTKATSGGDYEDFDKSKTLGDNKKTQNENETSEEAAGKKE